jgi:type VII secretion-associated serine protease mycosin
MSKGKHVTVAVLDGGVEQDIPELRNVVLPGLDLTGRETDGRRDLDKASHGTRMAVLIAGRPVDAESMSGVAPEASILPVALGGNGQFPDAAGLQTARAIRWSTDHDANVINMSYGGDRASGCPALLQSAILYALDHNVVLVAGAGNDGGGANLPIAPALCPGVVAVGAVDRDGRPWASSERQNYVDLAGPGVAVVSIGREGAARSGTGTSDAAALVSGAVALVRARFPGMPARQVVSRLLATARDAGPPGKDDQTGYGIVRPLNALTADVPADAPNPVYDEVDRLRNSVAAPAPGRAATEARSQWPVAAAVAGAAGIVAVLGVLLIRRRRVRAMRQREGR